MEKLVEASTAEAEAVSVMWQAAKAASVDSTEEEGSEGRSSGAHISDKFHVSDTSSDCSETDTLEPDVRLHPRAVCCLLFLVSFLFIYLEDTYLQWQTQDFCLSGADDVRLKILKSTPTTNNRH